MDGVGSSRLGLPVPVVRSRPDPKPPGDAQGLPRVLNGTERNGTERGYVRVKKARCPPFCDLSSFCWRTRNLFRALNRCRDASIINVFVDSM